MNNKSAHNFVFLALLSLSAACGSGVSSDPGSDATRGNVSIGAQCTNDNPCPDGQFCFNGLCALGCNSQGDCADSQYCDLEFDRLCHDKVVSTCPETACADSQICQNGFCSTEPSSTRCEVRPDGNDGCDTNAICIENEQEIPQCYSFPACPESGVCPTGLVGAVCNDDIIPNKGHICLTALCQNENHCPAQFSCIKGTNAVVGNCSDGNIGSVCLVEGDCQGGQCFSGLPGMPGICL